MASLSNLCTVTEDGVLFQHPTTGEMLHLRPEDSITAQNNIGSDIMMALDDVVSPTASPSRLLEANDRTLRWISRCNSANKNPQTQNLFPIVQGGLNKSERKKCVEGMIALDSPGYAIGGLSGGEEKSKFIDIVDYTANILPLDKPRYLMGVGYPVDVVICMALGVDMFDCVYPTRVARHGLALSRKGNLKLTKSHFEKDFRPIDEECGCETCRGYSRAFLHSQMKKQQVGFHMITKHNLHFMMELCKMVQDSIEGGKTGDVIRKFLEEWYDGGNEKIPGWVELGLEKAGI